MRKLTLIFALPMLIAAAGCGGSGGEKPSAAGNQAVLAQYGFDVIPGAEAMGTKKSNEAGNVDLYLVKPETASYEALVERYKKMLDQSKLQHGMPFPQKLTIDGKTAEFTGIGGADFSNTVNVYLSKPGQEAAGTLLAIEVDSR